MVIELVKGRSGIINNVSGDRGGCGLDKKIIMRQNQGTALSLLIFNPCFSYFSPGYMSDLRI